MPHLYLNDNNKNMIKEAYCSFEVAKLLKENGFDICVKSFYRNGTLKHNSCALAYYAMGDNILPAPTHQLAMAWLRQQGIFFAIIPYVENDNWWVKNVWDIVFYDTNGLPAGGFPIDGFEEAVEAALLYALEKLV